jgi:hypothetical protein
MKAKSLILFFISFQFLISCISIEKDIEIIGITTWDYWKKNAGWQDYEAKDFYIDYNKLDTLKKNLSSGNYSFIVFASAFCSECQEEIPKMFRIFTETTTSQDKIILIGIDKNNNEPTGTYKKYSIKSVPTVVVLKDRIEIGRINGSFKEIIDNLNEVLEGK